MATIEARMLTPGRMATAMPSFFICSRSMRGEMPVNYNGQAGYQIFYQTERGGRTWYGRRILLFSDNLNDNVGVDVNAQAERPETAGPKTVWEVAQADPLMRTVRSVKLASQ